MKRQIAVIGLGRFGVSLARTLYELGHDVLAVDIDEKPVQSISTRITHAVQADATDEAVLRGLGISDFDTAAVAIGTDIQSSVLATILLKKLGVPHVIARASNDLHGTILEKIGADKVVYVEQEMGVNAAHGLRLAAVLDYVTVSSEYGIVKVNTPPHFAGKSLAQLELGRDGKWGIAVLLIRREKELIVMPDTNDILQASDILVLSGKDDRLEKALAAPPENETDQ